MVVRTSRRDSLTPEQAFLLACVRRELSPADVLRMQGRADGGLDWDVLWVLACAHGVGDLVGRRLLDGKGVSLSEAFARRVRDDLCHAAIYGRVLLEYQTRLAGAFEQTGVAALWLKGLALSQQLYGRPEARQCGDLDVLVGAADLPRAEQQLKRFGFERLRREDPGLDCHAVSSHHVCWGIEVMHGWLLQVEVHHKLSGPSACQPSVPDLVRRSRLVDLGGQPVRVPSLEDELLLLCLHAHQHEFDFLRCLTDIAAYVEKYQTALDWPRLSGTAVACRAQGRLRAALALAEAVVGLGPAAENMQGIPGLKPLQRWAVRDLTRKVLCGVPGRSGGLWSVRLALLMDRWRDVLALTGPYLLPPHEYVRAVCPAPWGRVPGFARLYYLVRGVAKLVRDHASA